LLDHAATAYGAHDDTDYPDVMVISHGVPGFDATGAISQGFEANLVAAVKAVEVHRPAVVGVACNTAHLFTNSMRHHTGATFVSIIEATAEQAAAVDHSYLLLSSSTTRSQGLYHQALDGRGVRYCEADADEQLIIDRVVDLVMSFRLEEAGDTVEAFLESAATRRDFDAVIAGCTELPIALDHVSMSLDRPVVESNRALAVALVDRWARQANRSPVATSLLLPTT
jgi:aspartate racemase